MTTEDTKAQDAPTFTAAIKGFNADLTCRGFQFVAGGEYRHDGPVKACKSGFHVITGHPLAVFEYYAPAGSRFFRVEIGGATDSDDDDKTAAEILRVGQEIGFAELVAEAVKHVTDRARPEGEAATGARGAASATGYRGAASATGDLGAASATGDLGAASATGNHGAASATGARGAASATGYRGAASATGDLGAASATGDWSAASATGYRGAASATGEASVAVATGRYGRVKAAEGSGIALFERDDDGDIIAAFAGVSGRDGIKADTWYTLTGGKLTEVEG